MIIITENKLTPKIDERELSQEVSEDTNDDRATQFGNNKVYNKF